jgi:hypothetical protein
MTKKYNKSKLQKKSRKDFLRRTFNIKNIAGITVEISEYSFEPGEIKKCRLTSDELKNIKLHKSLKII